MLLSGGDDAHDVPTVLADGWENHLGDPILERAGLGFVRAHDHLVEAGLGDDFHVCVEVGVVRRGGLYPIHTDFIGP